MHSHAHELTLGLAFGLGANFCWTPTVIVTQDNRLNKYDVSRLFDRRFRIRNSVLNRVLTMQRNRSEHNDERE